MPVVGQLEDARPLELHVQLARQVLQEGVFLPRGLVREILPQVALFAGLLDGLADLGDLLFQEPLDFRAFPLEGFRRAPEGGASFFRPGKSMRTRLRMAPTG